MRETLKVMTVEQIRTLFESSDIGFQVRDVRPYPEEVAVTVQAMLRSGQDLGQIVEYARAAFGIFVQSVNRGFDVPHINTPGGVSEWLTPASLDWGDISAVTTLGQHVDQDHDTVNVYRDNRVFETTVLANNVLLPTVVRDLHQGERDAANMGHTFGYKVPHIEAMGIVPVQNEWQSGLLVAVHNPLVYLRNDLRTGRASVSQGRDVISEIVDRMQRPQRENLIVIVPQTAGQ